MNATNASLAPATTAVAPTLRACACGCGTPTASVWAPGHDGRAKGLLRSVARGERTIDSLPGVLAKEGMELAAKWGMLSADGSFNEAARKVPNKRPSSQHPAVRTLLRAKDQLAEQPALAEVVQELIDDLTNAAGSEG